MTILLSQIPGISDLPDSLFKHDNPALGMLITRISGNAAFGMVHLEVFDGIYINGDTVPLPISPIDHYVYSRSECIYLWNNDVSTNPNTGWIQSGSGSLYFCEWDVNQTTGQVFSLEWYRTNGSGGSRSQTNDGHIHVYTIGQRQRASIYLTAPLPTYNVISEANIATDKALIDTTVHIPLNQNAKFACINHEVFYCGEFYNGQQVPLPSMVSPYDSYNYAYSEAVFIGCYRWTTLGNAATVTQPEETFGQMGPFYYSIDSTGHVTVGVWTSDNDSNKYNVPTFGRIAVFAFCIRSATPVSYSALANQFTEQVIGTFQSGKALRASQLLQLKRNIDEALITPEWFLSQHANGDTIPTPVSPIDGYAYSYSECTFLWVWATTMNCNDGTGHRLPVFYGGINATTHVLGTSCWRLNSHYVHDFDFMNRVNILTIARRGAATALTSGSANVSSPSDISTSTLVPGTDSDAYLLTFDMGGGRTTPPASNESLLRHIVGGNLTSVTLDAGLTKSLGGTRTAPTNPYAITINKTTGGVTSSIGSINFAAGANVATFTMASAQTLIPGDVLEFLGATAADATIRGIYFTISGIRNQ